MGLFDHFPYTNFHEINLMWILEALKEIQTTTEQFVAINSLKYANPIQWNIVKQYEKNTIVIDPLTGIAYISVQSVPTGVALTNEDYWTVVFDLGAFVTRAAKNFTTRYEADTTLTATFNSNIGDWIVWGDVLYKALVNINAGDQYVIGSNILHITIEEIVKNIYDYFLLYIGALNTLVTTNKTDIVSALNEVYITMKAQDGELNNLSTTDKSNLVAAINEVLLTLITTAGDLNNLSTTDKSNLVAAINEVVNSIISETQTRENTVGDLNNLNTTNKSNLVAAINENNFLVKQIRDLKTRKYIFVGDSYGTIATNWVASFVGYAGIPASNYYNACIAGAGFNRGGVNGFLTGLQNAYTAVDDPNAITDIIILGGINDTDNTWDFGGELSAIASTATYIATNFPNATVRIGFSGNMNYDSPLYTDPANTQNNDLIPDVVSCWKISGGFGWHYIDNMENVIKWNEYISADGLHPDINGANAIAIALLSSMIGISTTVTRYKANTSATITAGSSGAFSGTPTLTNYLVDDNTVTFDFNNINLINIVHAPNTDIEVLTVSDMPQKGAKSANTCCGTAMGFVALIDSNNATRFKMCCFDCQFYNGTLHVNTILINDAGSGYESDNITAVNIPHIHMTGHAMLM